MPYARETLSDLRTGVLADIATRLPGSAPFQRRTVENVFGTVFAALQNVQLGQGDWISKQAVPVTAEAEYLSGWAGLRDVTQEGPTVAFGTVQVAGAAPNATIAVGSTGLLRSDNALYAVTAGATVADDGTATLGVTATVAGSAGNCNPGDALRFTSPPAGIPPTAIVVTIGGGADLETTDSFRTRSNQAWANPPQGGDLADYVKWAGDEVPAVTRAWSAGPALMGAGTVTVYFCIDDANHSNGLPIGSNGVSQYELRPAVTATGDQLIVADALYAPRSATALVYAAAPTGVPLNITLQEVPADATIRAGIAAAVAGLLLRAASPCGVQVVRRLASGLLVIEAGGIIRVSDIEGAIAAVPNLDHFVMTSPAADVVLSVNGQISTVGSIGYSNPS